MNLLSLSPLRPLPIALALLWIGVAAAQSPPEVSPWTWTEERAQTATAKAVLSMPDGALERLRVFMGEQGAERLPGLQLLLTPAAAGQPPTIELGGATRNADLRFEPVVRAYRATPEGYELLVNLRVDREGQAARGEVRVRLRQKGAKLSVSWAGPFWVLPLRPLRMPLPSMLVQKGAAAFKVPAAICERLLVHAERTKRIPESDLTRPYLRGLALQLSTEMENQALLHAEPIEGCQARAQLLPLGPESSAERWRRILRLELDGEPYHVVVVMTPKGGEVSGPYLDLPELGAEIPEPNKPKFRLRKR